VFLESLQLLQFRNWESLSLRFSPGLNLITGPNGLGKTNILDAVYTLCLAKSYLSAIDTQNIRKSEKAEEDIPFFMLEGQFFKEGKTEHIQCTVRKGQKKLLKRNKKEYERLADHVGKFPVVMIAPQDAALIHGSSEDRRRFMDALICQYAPHYLEDLLKYNRLIQQRNALFKQVEDFALQESTLHVYDLQLEGPAERILQQRNAFLRVFLPLFSSHYAKLSGEKERPDLHYSATAPEGTWRSATHAAISKDRILRYSTVGPHRDDLVFTLEGMVVKKFASQGQQKTFLTALKLAEWSLLHQQTGVPPLLLLDDIFDKLDPNRVGRLILQVKNLGQILITDTDPKRLPQMLDELAIPFEATLLS
jgi:DNA replication and repair protein RecF